MTGYTLVNRRLIAQLNGYEHIKFSTIADKEKFIKEISTRRLLGCKLQPLDDDKDAFILIDGTKATVYSKNKFLLYDKEISDGGEMGLAFDISNIWEDTRFKSIDLNNVYSCKDTILLNMFNACKAEMIDLGDIELNIDEHSTIQAMFRYDNLHIKGLANKSLSGINNLSLLFQNTTLTGDIELTLENNNNISSFFNGTKAENVTIYIKEGCNHLDATAAFSCAYIDKLIIKGLEKNKLISKNMFANCTINELVLDGLRLTTHEMFKLSSIKKIIVNNCIIEGALNNLWTT